MSTQILFVDDEAPVRELLSLYFRKKGFEVRTAVTNAEARELIGRQRFDAAILDVNLAGENGLELMSVLKKEQAGIPIFIFTGLYSDPQVVKRAMAEGAAGVMSKTQSLDQLFAEVSRHLPKAPAAASAP